MANKLLKRIKKIKHLRLTDDEVLLMLDLIRDRNTYLEMIKMFTEKRAKQV